MISLMMLFVAGAAFGAGQYEAFWIWLALAALLWSD